MKKRRWILLVTLFVAFAAGIFGVVNTVSAGSVLDATNYTMGTTVSGTTTSEDKDHFYKFTLNSSGCVNIKANTGFNYAGVTIYDNSSNELWKEDTTWNETAGISTLDKDVYLTSGIYYASIGSYWSDRTGNYQLTLKFTHSNESFAETNGGINNEMANASEIKTDGDLYRAQIAVNDEKDFYKFSLEESGSVDLAMTFYKICCVYINIYDEDGEEIYDETPSWNDTTKNIAFNQRLWLTSGTYYLSVRKFEYGDYYERYGKYDFKLQFQTSDETYTEANGGSNNTMEKAREILINQRFLKYYPVAE